MFQRSFQQCSSNAKPPRGFRDTKVSDLHDLLKEHIRQQQLSLHYAYQRSVLGRSAVPTVSLFTGGSVHSGFDSNTPNNHIVLRCDKQLAEAGCLVSVAEETCKLFAGRFDVFVDTRVPRGLFSKTLSIDINTLVRANGFAAWLAGLPPGRATLWQFPLQLPLLESQAYGYSRHSSQYLASLYLEAYVGQSSAAFELRGLQSQWEAPGTGNSRRNSHATPARSGA